MTGAVLAGPFRAALVPQAGVGGAPQAWAGRLQPVGGHRRPQADPGRHGGRSTGLHAGSRFAGSRWGQRGRGHERQAVDGVAGECARRRPVRRAVPQGPAAGRRGPAGALQLPAADRLPQGDCAGRGGCDPVVGPACRDRGARRAGHRLRPQPAVAEPGAGGLIGMGDRPRAGGGGPRRRASGGAGGRDPGRACLQARALALRRGADAGPCGQRGCGWEPAAALPRRRAAADGIDAAPAGIVPAGRECGRSHPAAHARHRPRRALRGAGRRRHRPAGVPGAAGPERTRRRSPPSSGRWWRATASTS